MPVMIGDRGRGVDHLLLLRLLSLLRTHLHHGIEGFNPSGRHRLTLRDLGHRRIPVKEVERPLVAGYLYVVARPIHQPEESGNPFRLLCA